MLLSLHWWRSPFDLGPPVPGSAPSQIVIRQSNPGTVKVSMATQTVVVNTALDLTLPMTINPEVTVVVGRDTATVAVGLGTQEVKL